VNREAIVKLRVLLSLAAIAAVGLMGTGVAGASPQPNEYFTSIQTSANGPQTITAAGPISATGTDVQLGAHRDNFVFPAGTLTVRHEPQTTSQKFDSRTCVGTFTETGTYDISNGTGAYKHVTGSGHYKVSGVIQGCDPNAPPMVFTVIIQAHGPIFLG
jgi:hypothetical protein